MLLNCEMTQLVTKINKTYKLQQEKKEKLSV